MELMDWKNMEQGAEEQIRDGRSQITIGTILLKEAVIQIKKLGGKTNAEIDKDVGKPHSPTLPSH